MGTTARSGASGAPPAGRVWSVVVDHNGGRALVECLRSILAQGVAGVVVVENGDHAAGQHLLEGAGLSRRVHLLHCGRNLGYGAGANRGAAAAQPPDAAADRPGAQPPDYLLVSNSDLRLHDGALAALVAALDADPAAAAVGPAIFTPAGEPYPSVRPFPSALDAAGHALLGAVRPQNRFTRRYRPEPPSRGAVTAADWISGACMLLRRTAFEEVGGFDERYFMFAEDMDLCWRLHRAGWGVAFAPAAAVTHVQGLSTRRHPYRMLLAHHRSALRFAASTAEGWRRLLLPLAAALLGARLVATSAAEAIRRAAGR